MSLTTDYPALRTPFTQSPGGHGWTALKEKYRLEHERVRAWWIVNGGEVGDPSYVEDQNEYIRTGEWRSEILKEAS